MERPDFFTLKNGKKAKLPFTENEYQNRLNSYKRADIGISYVVSESEKLKNKKWLQQFKELAIGFEIYNMFNKLLNYFIRV